MFHHLFFQAFDFLGHVAFAHVLDAGLLQFQAHRLFVRLFTVDPVNQVADALDHPARRDAIGGIEADLLVATPLGFTNGPLHRLGHFVGVQNGAAFQIASRTSDGLNQAALGTQKPLFVGVQDGHQRHLGQVQTFTQQIDAHQHIKRAQAQVAQNFHPLHRVDVAVQIAHLDAVVAQIIGELLGHAFGEGGDQNPLVFHHPNADFLQHIVHLVDGGSHLDHRIDQTGGAHHLLHHIARVGFFIVRGRGRHKHQLAHALFKFINFQGTVVQGAGQAKPVFHQGGFASAVAVVHAGKLAHQHMAFVQEHQSVFGQVIGQRAGRLTRGCA